MSLLKDYIEWVRKQMKREEETPVVVEPQVQPVVTEQRPKRKPRAKKTND
jgi:ribonuclease PH